MLVMESKQYRGEATFREHLATLSGECNAHVRNDDTTVWFVVGSKTKDRAEPPNSGPLYSTLKRLCAFFVSVYFDKEKLERELEKVHSEYIGYRSQDSLRLGQLERSHSNRKHPYSRFNFGNRQTMKTDPEKGGIDVLRVVKEFSSRHFSAHRMRLAVLGPEPLDQLQEWVVELCTPVPNNGIPADDWSKEPLFRDEDLAIQCFAQSVENKCSLTLRFPFLNHETGVRDATTSNCITKLFRHDQEGGIARQLKDNGWATGISALIYNICLDSLGIFEFYVELTNKARTQHTWNPGLGPLGGD